jgi:hypothetical protein
MWNVMTACVIMHNMIVEDERDDSIYDQAGWTATQILSWPRRKRIRTDRLHRQDASARWRCPQKGNSYATGAYTYSLYI